MVVAVGVRRLEDAVHARARCGRGRATAPPAPCAAAGGDVSCGPRVPASRVRPAGGVRSSRRSGSTRLACASSDSTRLACAPGRSARLACLAGGSTRVACLAGGSARFACPAAGPAPLNGATRAHRSTAIRAVEPGGAAIVTVRPGAGGGPARLPRSPRV